MENEHAIKYIPIKRLRRLQNSIGWLETYQGPEDNVSHKIANNIHEKDVEHTDLLIELGNINKRRQEIINKLMTK